MFFSGRRLLDRSVKIRLSSHMFCRPGTSLNKISQNGNCLETCCSVFSLINHTLSIYSKISCNTPMLSYPLSNQQLQHALRVYQNVQSTEECLEFVCSLDSSIISIWISTLLASSEIAHTPFIWLKRKKNSDVLKDLYFQNLFDTSIKNAVRRPRCAWFGVISRGFP